MSILLFAATITIALLAQWHVNRTYLRYSRVPSDAGRTGAEVALSPVLSMATAVSR